MDILKLDQARDEGFLQRLQEESGQDLSLCYQCGNCTAGCPGGQFYDRQVSQIMRACQLGLKQEALGNKSLWLCLSCYTCTARCPNNIDVTAIMETLRQMARREGMVQSRPIESFWKAFMDMVRLHGRSYEFGVMADFVLRTGKGLNNLEIAPTALAKHKMPFLPDRIKGREQVAAIIRRYTAETRS